MKSFLRRLRFILMIVIKISFISWFGKKIAEFFYYAGATLFSVEIGKSLDKMKRGEATDADKVRINTLFEIGEKENKREAEKAE